MSARRRGAGAVAVLALATAVLSACTGVPVSSAPQTVEPILPAGPPDVPAIVPEDGASPQTIVADFLQANAVDPDKHTSARAFFTAAERNRWSDLTATVVTDESVGIYNARKRVLTVTARVLGKINASGIYTPSLQSSNTPPVQFGFGLRRIHGQYRIDSLTNGFNGLLLTDDQFRAAYRPQSLYYYDLAEKYLVPDQRYTALVEHNQLAQWLLTQLVDGPRPELQNAVSTDTFPAQADSRRITVALGTPTKVEIPGSGQLGAAVRDRLAAQVGQTLSTALSGGSVAITDNGTAVRIPATGSDQFTAANFAAATGPPTPPAEVYYLADGRLHNSRTKSVPGPLGNGSAFLDAAAVRRTSRGLDVAGVQGTGSAAKLLVGTSATGLKPVALRGQLSRPDFAPGLPEVWLAAGSRLYRVTMSGSGSKVSRVPIPSAAGGGRIVAMRLSPDGSRVALVISGVDGLAQLYVGSIVRSAGQVRIDTLAAISPAGVVITDVDWFDPFKLFAIGYVGSSQNSQTFETEVDGSDWTDQRISGLPTAPDSVAVTENAPAWVSANGYVWVQNGSSWSSPGPGGQTPGTEPVYLS